MKNETLINTLKGSKKLKLLLLPLISSAAVLRKEKNLRDLLKLAKIGNLDGIKVYEALLQTYLFAGFPCALNSMQIAAELFPPNHKFKNVKNSFREVGVINCKKIYGNKFDKLLNNISAFSPELSEWLIIEGYGKVFNRNTLSLKSRELCNVAVLASLRYESQLYSHINGAFHSRNSLGDIETVIEHLHFTGGKAIKNFGMKVFEKYLIQKGVKNSFTPS